MSTAVKIQIEKLGRKSMPSKYKEGDTYSITTIKDSITGRKGSAIGGWADNWKEGDSVEAIWSPREFTDKDGFTQKTWSLENPNKNTKTGSWGPKKPTLVDAYMIAAALAPVLFKEGKVNLDKITKLADEVFKKISGTVASSTGVTDIDVSESEKSPVTKKPTKKVDSDFDVEDEDDTEEDDPF